MPLHIKIIIGLVAGALFALLSSFFGISGFVLDWIYPFGEIFIRLLKMIAVPLVLFSIIKGVSGFSEFANLGRLGAKTFGIYIVTTVIAIAVGLLTVNIIAPGKLVDNEQREKRHQEYLEWKNRGIGTTDAALAEKVSQAQQAKDSGPLQMLVDVVPSNIFDSLGGKGSMLQVIFFAIFFGVMLLMIPSDKAKPVLDFVDGANEVFMKMVEVIMLGAPYFVFALLAGVIAKMAGDDLNQAVEIFKGLGWYSLSVVIGLAILLFVTYPIMVHFITGKKISYPDFFRGIAPAQFLAFSTSSSAATLPVTIECVNDNLKIPKKITSFVLPIGATINMDGTSLYQAIAVIFLAQLHMVDLTFGQQLTIVLTATLASIGSAAVPSAGLIMLIIVLDSVGLNPAWIAIIFPVDRILDMCRTVINVTGDAAVCTIMAKSEGELTTA